MWSGASYCIGCEWPVPTSPFAATQFPIPTAAKPIMSSTGDKAGWFNVQIVDRCLIFDEVFILNSKCFHIYIVDA